MSTSERSRTPYRRSSDGSADKLGTAGIRLRQHRLAKRMTIDQLSVRAGLTMGFISAIENNKAGFGPDSLQKLARALDTSVGALFDIDPREGHSAAERPQPLFLSEWREHRGLTQAAMAKEIGTTNVTISRWEAGKRFPDLDAQIAIAQALNILPSDLWRHPNELSVDGLLRGQSPSVKEQAVKLIKAIMAAP